MRLVAVCAPLRVVFLLAIGLTAIGAVGQTVPDAAPAQSAPGKNAGMDDSRGLPLRRADEMLTSSILLRVGAVLVLGAVLVVLAALVMRRFLLRPVAGNGRRIDILEARRATAQLTLVLVRIDDRELLVGQSGDGVALLYSTAGAEPSPHE